MQNIGFKKPGIRQWVSEHPTLSYSERRGILEDNERAVKTAKKLGLPLDMDFGSFDTLDEAVKAIPEEFRKGGLFIIRCPHRTEDIIQRKLFVPWDELVNFVQALPGGFQQYRLGIREVTIPVWSGTIICSDNGASVLIETWKGKHLEMDEGNERTSFRGVYRDHPESPRRFVWSEGCSDEIKYIMLNALRYLAPDLRPKRNVFVEFSLTEKGYRFHGASFNPFWVGQKSWWPLSVNGD